MRQPAPLVSMWLSPVTAVVRMVGQAKVVQSTAGVGWCSTDLA